MPRGGKRVGAGRPRAVQAVQDQSEAWIRVTGGVFGEILAFARATKKPFPEAVRHLVTLGLEKAVK